MKLHKSLERLVERFHLLLEGAPFPGSIKSRVQKTIGNFIASLARHKQRQPARQLLGGQRSGPSKVVAAVEKLDNETESIGWRIKVTQAERRPNGGANVNLVARLSGFLGGSSANVGGRKHRQYNVNFSLRPSRKSISCMSARGVCARLGARCWRLSVVLLHSEEAGGE